MAGEIEIRESGNQFVIGRIPSWIAKWGNVVILAICLLLLYISFHLTFPVVIQGQVQIAKDSIYVIIPSVKQDLIREGQDVGLRLDDYPYMDFGILQGKVAPLGTAIHRGNAIHVLVCLNKDSNAVNQSNLLPGMQGTGDIIIEQVPLIDRILKTK